MPTIRKLHRMDQLRDSGFGRPPPRHGLNLLYWFSTECIYFTCYDQIARRCDPLTSEFGFHFFSNKPDGNGVRLLPQIHRSYYIVGNLNEDGASELPGYVLDHHTGLLDGGNTDRIIVNWSFDQVYITQHSDRWNFDPSTTYRISWSLLKKIRQMSRVGFLEEMGYDDDSEDDYTYSSGDVRLLVEERRFEVRPPPRRYNPGVRTVKTSRNRSCCDCCTIL